jgi:hypothetical protein
LFDDNTDCPDGKISIMTDPDKCFCFPSREKFAEAYIKAVDNNYLAEKTVKDVSDTLAGSCKKNFAIVPIIASADFEQYVCNTSTQSTCAVVRMNAEIHHDQIATALKTISTPCPCE